MSLKEEKKKVIWQCLLKNAIQRPKRKVVKRIVLWFPGHCPCPSLEGNAGVSDCRSEEQSLQRNHPIVVYIFLDKMGW